MPTYPYETVIAYEDRAKVFTHDWRFAGVKTTSSGNTDGGLLYFSLTKSSNTFTADVYEVEAKESGDKVATGSVESTSAPSEASPLSIALSESNSSGLTGALKIADYSADETAGYLQVLLAVDADAGKYFAGYDVLNAYDSSTGLAESHNLAMFEIIDKMSARFSHELGGYGKSPWWQSGSKRYPDLRRILNPAQLRKAAAHYALYEALMASTYDENSAYWNLMELHKREYQEAMSSIQIALDADTDGDGDKHTAIGVTRWQRA